MTARHDVAPRNSSAADARSGREQQVLDRIEKARKRGPKVREERITLSHGSGGKATQTLVEAIFLDAFRNPLLEPLEDAATFTVPTPDPASRSSAPILDPASRSSAPILDPASRSSVDRPRLALTTDSFVVTPLFFPGGNIGDLAVNGTVNDLAVSGARPLYLTAGFILEEGFAVADLRRIVASMRTAADVAGVSIVTGDTKVVQRGKADGCYINTAGVGLIERAEPLGIATVRPGDAVLVSGPIGDHGVTIMLARGELDIEADLQSDTAPVHGLVADLLRAAPGVRAMRDATRGGVATILNEVARSADVAVVVDEDKVPVSAEVRGASELLGIDPLYVACEGRVVVFVDGADADAALDAMHAHPLGEQAAVIGRVRADPPGVVLLNTAFGGTRICDLLVGDPLPRIC